MSEVIALKLISFNAVGLEKKLRGLCDELLGPVFKSKRTKAWEDSILVSQPMLYR